MPAMPNILSSQNWFLPFSLGQQVLLGLVLLLLGTWWRLRHRRRKADGRLTEVERRFDATLRRFKIEIDRFKLTRQSAVKTLLNHDHAIWTQVEQMALEGENREELRVKVNTYVEEIVPFFKPLIYFKFGRTLAGTVLNGMYRIDYRPEEVARIKAISNKKPSSVVYLMNHRSNVDYLLAAYVLAEDVALSFAVGEWARVWPLEYLFKAFGSYFLRRGFRDVLYHTVLRRYVQLVTKNGVTQAMFPEGGLSRDGRIRAPKIGLLDAIICSREDRSFTRELLFVPVAINYDRVLEDRVLLQERGGKKHRMGKLRMGKRVLDILFGNISKFARKKLRKNGMAAVRFGEPVSLDAWLKERQVDIFAMPKEERRAQVAEFCNVMMTGIADLIPITPLCLVARHLLLHPEGICYAQLLEDVEASMKSMSEKGVDVVLADRGAQFMVDGALLRFSARALISISGNPDTTEYSNEQCIKINPDNNSNDVLKYYHNAIIHHFDGQMRRPTSAFAP